MPLIRTFIIKCGAVLGGRSIWQNLAVGEAYWLGGVLYSCLPQISLQRYWVIFDFNFQGKNRMMLNLLSKIVYYSCLVIIYYFCHSFFRGRNLQAPHVGQSLFLSRPACLPLDWLIISFTLSYHANSISHSLLFRSDTLLLTLSWSISQVTRLSVTISNTPFSFLLTTFIPSSNFLSFAARFLL